MDSAAPQSNDASHETSRRGRLMEIAWSALIIVLIGFFVHREWSSVRSSLLEVRRADRGWLLLLICAGLTLHAFLTQSLSEVLRVLGKRIPFLPAYGTHMERETIATVMPMGGIASFVVLTQRFKRFGVTASDAGLATLLYSAVGHIAFLTVALPTLIWFARSQGASAPIWIGLAVIVMSVLALIGLIVACMRGVQFPDRIERRLPSFANQIRSTAQDAHLTLHQFVPAIGLGILGDLFGVVAVYCALRCTHAHPSLALSASAYVIGTIFMLAAPIFQGVGFVEVSMTAVMVRLGMSMPIAIGATLLYRIVEIWMPLMLGIGVRAQRQTRVSRLILRVPALWTIFNGFAALTILLPHPRNSEHGPVPQRGMLHEGHEWVLAHPNHISRNIMLVAGFMLILLGLRLLRRLRSAWVVSLVLLSVNCIVLLTNRHTTPALVLTLTNIALLVQYRKHFRVRSDVPSVRRGITLLVLAAAITYAFAVMTLYLVPQRSFHHAFSFRASLRTAVNLLLQRDTGIIPYSPFAEWSLDAIHLLELLAIVVGTIAVLQPIVLRQRVRRNETMRAAHLIEQYGDSALDRFKYWPDKHQFFGADGKGVVSYGVSGRVALVLGDPTAPSTSDREHVLEEFLGFCDVNGWEPAFHQVGSANLPLYRAHGFAPFEIGKEAIADAATFSLQVPGVKNLRSTWNKAARESITVETTTAPLPCALVDELQSVSDAWLTIEGRRERTFTLGQWDRDYIRECTVLVVRTADGTAQAFINMIPDGRPGEMTFDLMRHRPGAPNGCMDLLMIAMLEHAKASGARTVSLGMVPWVRQEDEIDTDAPDLQRRALDTLTHTMEQFFASKSLFAYKDKFHPVWEPRYLVTRGWRQVPRAAMALTNLAELHSPDARSSFGAGPIGSMVTEWARKRMSARTAKTA